MREILNCERQGAHSTGGTVCADMAMAAGPDDSRGSMGSGESESGDHDNPNSPNAVHPAKGTFNIGMGAYGTWVNPAAGMLYFGVDAFYPGGWPGAMENMDRTQRANQEILGPNWRLIPLNKW